MLAFYSFWFIWTSFYLSHTESFVLTAVACIWYFAVDRSYLGSPVCTAFTWAFYWHSGTIAFGSLILTIIYIINQIIENAVQSQEEAMRNGEGNATAAFILCCLQCLAQLFESWAQFLSKHAYIETALRNSSFCRAARDAFSIIISNIWRIGVLHGITGLALFFGNLFIAVLVTLIAYILMKSLTFFNSLVFETVAPLIVRPNNIGAKISLFFLHQTKF